MAGDLDKYISLWDVNTVVAHLRQEHCADLRSVQDIVAKLQQVIEYHIPLWQYHGDIVNLKELQVDGAAMSAQY